MQRLGQATDQDFAFYRQATQKISELPGVEGVSMGAFAPWRDAGKLGGLAGITFGADGFTPSDGEENPRARIRVVAPDFFHVMGVPLIAGRDFTPEDRSGSEAVVIVSQSLAQRIYPNGEALNHKVWWIDPIFGPKPFPRRIIGIVADVDDERIAHGPVMTVYHALNQFGLAGRMFVRASGDPHALVKPVTKSSRDCRSISPLSAPRRSKTCAPKCSRPAHQGLCVYRLRRRRAADRGGGRGRRAGVRRQRADARNSACASRSARRRICC
jgi:hypothetical protein